jgi:hypothetical protein
MKNNHYKKDLKKHNINLPMGKSILYTKLLEKSTPVDIEFSL